MDQLAVNACLTEIRRLWLDTSDGNRPAHVWIAQHEAVTEDTDNPSTPVTNAWFMDIHGIENRPASGYVRFINVHSGALWSSAMIPPPAIGVFNNRPGSIHTIGVAVFAPIQTSTLIYLHHIWRGLSGRGGQYCFDSKTNTLECVKNTWLS